jgi:hypothetical protein
MLAGVQDGGQTAAGAGSLKLRRLRFSGFAHGTAYIMNQRSKTGTCKGVLAFVLGRSLKNLAGQTGDDPLRNSTRTSRQLPEILGPLARAHACGCEVVVTPQGTVRAGALRWRSVYLWLIIGHR